MFRLSFLLQGNNKFHDAAEWRPEGHFLFIPLFRLVSFFRWLFFKRLSTLCHPEPWRDLSVRVYLTRVFSRFLRSYIQLQEVLVSRRAAKPGFAKMNRASQKVLIPSRMHTTLCWNIDVSTPAPSSGSTPGKHPALLSEQPTQSHHGSSVVVSARRHLLKRATAGYRDSNRRDKEEI